MLAVTFVRRRGSRDRVYVKRGDGSQTGWDFPSYGDGLPHDLCHLVVEDGLGLSDGFWGLVDQGVEVGLVNNQATLMRDGRPLVDQPRVDFSGLRQAEGAVALLASPALEIDQVGALAIAHLGSSSISTPSRQEVEAHLGVELPDSVTQEVVAAIRARLAELGYRWRSLADGGSIELVFPRPCA